MAAVVVAAGVLAPAPLPGRGLRAGDAEPPSLMGSWAASASKAVRRIDGACDKIAVSAEPRPPVGWGGRERERHMAMRTRE